jgi:hypothetical protein
MDKDDKIKPKALGGSVTAKSTERAQPLLVIALVSLVRPTRISGKRVTPTGGTQNGLQCRKDARIQEIKVVKTNKNPRP